MQPASCSAAVAPLGRGVGAKAREPSCAICSASSVPSEARAQAVVPEGDSARPARGAGAGGRARASTCVQAAGVRAAAAGAVAGTGSAASPPHAPSLPASKATYSTPAVTRHVRGCRPPEGMASCAGVRPPRPGGGAGRGGRLRGSARGRPGALGSAAHKAGESRASAYTPPPASAHPPDSATPTPRVASTACADCGPSAVAAREVPEEGRSARAALPAGPRPAPLPRRPHPASSGR